MEQSRALHGLVGPVTHGLWPQTKKNKNKPSRDPNCPGSTDLSAELSGFSGRRNPSNDPQEVHHPTPFEKRFKNQVLDPKLAESEAFSDGPTICHMARSHHLPYDQISPFVTWSGPTICHLVRSHHLPDGQISPSVTWSDPAICHVARSDHLSHGCPGNGQRKFQRAHFLGQAGGNRLEPQALRLLGKNESPKKSKT